MGKSGFDMDAASCQGCAYAAIAKVGRVETFPLAFDPQ